jgi:hypothetical protein
VNEMCAEMIAYDLDIAKRQVLLRKHGHKVAISHEG